MQFSLKDIKTIYQHAMSTIFLYHLYKTMECYVNNIAIKNHCEKDHLSDLKIMLDIMRSY